MEKWKILITPVARASSTKVEFQLKILTLVYF